MSLPPRETMLSGVQPTNALHLGNYVGALRQWQQQQESYDCFFCAVDLHAITLRQDPAALRESTYRTVATYIASGLNPERCALFVQSHVPEHAELGWVLGCHTHLGELSRMTQFKDKSSVGQNVGFGLLSYPTLMAADILLYQANRVPVGADQKQHLELTRDLAERVNTLYGKPLFVVPEPLIAAVGAKILSLQDPARKMSKSDPNPKACIFLTDSDKAIEKKLKGAVTDSGSVVEYTADKPGIMNLLNIQAALLRQDPATVAAGYAGKLYGHLKVDTAALVVERVSKLRGEVDRLMADRAQLDGVLAIGADKARQRARKTLDAVYDAVGFVLPRRRSTKDTLSGP